MAKKPTEKERFEVLVEDLKAEFRHVADRVIALDEKVDTKIGELKNTLEYRIGLVETAIMEHSKQIHQLDTTVGDLKIIIEELRVDVKELKHRVDFHEQAHVRG